MSEEGFTALEAVREETWKEETKTRDQYYICILIGKEKLEYRSFRKERRSTAGISVKNYISVNTETQS